MVRVEAYLKLHKLAYIKKVSEKGGFEVGTRNRAGMQHRLLSQRAA